VKKQAADAETAVAVAGFAAREAKLAQREAELSQREGDVTSREKDLAAREKALAALTEQVAQTQAQLVAQLKSAPAAVPQPETGTPLSARDVPRAQLVDQRHKKLLADLAERGILISDFAPEDQPLNAEIWAARRRGDVTRAWDLLGDLQKAFAKVKVDRKFIEGKMVRLQGARSSATLGDGQRREVEKLLRDVTSAYSDGKYEQANKGLNRIASILDAAPAPG
jgi:hypothetical protein